MQLPRKEGQLDVPVLHQDVLGGLLGINEEAVRDEKFIKYVRGIDAAAAEVRSRERRSRSCWNRRRSTIWLGSRSRAA